MLAYLSPAFLFSLDFLVRLFLFSQMSKQRLKVYESVLFSIVVGLLALVLRSKILYVEPLFLFVVAAFLRPSWKISEYLFYCLLPFSIIDMSQRMSGVYEIKKVVFDFPADSFEMYVFMTVGMLVFLAFYYFFVKVLRIDLQNISRIFTYPQFRWLIWILNGFMIFYNLVIHTILVWSGDVQDSSLTFRVANTEIIVDLNLLQLLIFSGAILYFNFKIKEILVQELQESKDQQLSAMTSYSSHIEALYRDIRSFRHDYTNLLISFKEAIRARDLEAVETIYDSVLADSDKDLKSDSFEIAKLTNLTNPAMKSIVSAKLLEATSKGIGISIELEEALDMPAEIESIDMLKVLSIFLDNALEAAAQAKNPYIAFGFFQEGKEKILLIENASAEERVNTKEIFTYGKSSKGSDRGVGLATVRDILDKYPQMFLQTTSRHYVFRQELRIEE